MTAETGTVEIGNKSDGVPEARNPSDSIRADVEDARQFLRQGSANGARCTSARPPTESADEPTSSDTSTALSGAQAKADPWSTTSAWGLKFVDHYGWIADVADEPIDLSMFDARSITAFRRGNIRTWGELGGQTNESLHAIRGIGDLTVRRINQVLTAQGPVVRERLAIDALQRQTGPEREHSSAPPNFNLRIAIEWASAHTDDRTLAGLLKVYDREVEIPANVADETETLLAAPLSRLTDQEVPPLGELIEELLSEAKDPELLASREFSQVRPTLAELGRERGVSRERVRQKVAKDAKHVRKLLACERFQTVRWAVERLQAEFGFAIPTDSEPVKRWETRLGDRKSRTLRWLAGYVYDGDWICRGKGGRSHLRSHRTNLIRHYFPKASRQVVLLSTDQEIIGDHLDLLRPHIGIEQCLVFNETDASTTVTMGYFDEYGCNRRHGPG